MMFLRNKRKKYSHYPSVRRTRVPVKKASSQVIFQNLIKKILGPAVFIIIFFLLVQSSKSIQPFPIRNIRLIATFQHLEPQNIRFLIASYTPRGFFAFNPQELSKDLLRIPWVHDVSVQKIWPDRVVIHLGEQHPVAIWNNKFLLNQDGQIFQPKGGSFPAGLAHLFGPDDSSVEVLQNYLVIKQVVQSLGYSNISELAVDEYQSWRLLLPNGLTLLLGSQSVLDRLKLFTHLYPKIHNTNKSAKIADLRYKNGFAIQWEDTMGSSTYVAKSDTQSPD
ncbi:MAG: cell division protein FtsQ/DivIB [Gammaproteobacteria bacterium]